MKLPACDGQKRRRISLKHFHCSNRVQQSVREHHHSLTCWSTEFCPSSSWRHFPVTRVLWESVNKIMVSAICCIFDLHKLISSQDYWYTVQMFYVGRGVSPAHPNLVYLTGSARVCLLIAACKRQWVWGVLAWWCSEHEHIRFYCPAVHCRKKLYTDNQKT